MTAVRAAILLLAFLLPCSGWGKRPTRHLVKPNWPYVESKLKKASFDSRFIRDIKRSYSQKDFHQVLELNVLLFLRKSNDHGPQVSDEAVKDIRSFMRKNKSALTKAEKNHRVASPVIASLLWLESRHGKNTGRFHVPSVYLHLLQADRKPVIRHLKDNATKFAKKVSRRELKKIEKRTHDKSEWALSQLRAIQKAHRWKWQDMKTFQGSFAGAFGIPQFIPSSYIKWARSQNPQRPPDLMRADDAIESVAYYLKDHGWKRSGRHRQLEALMKYNHSRDYANAILDLSKRVADPPSNEERVPADQSRKAPRN